MGDPDVERDSEFDYRAICKSRWSSRVGVDKELLFPGTGVRKGSLRCERSGGGHCVIVQTCKEFGFERNSFTLTAGGLRLNAPSRAFSALTCIA